jgi:hypothetical protein
MKTPEDEAFEEIERIQRARTRWVPVEKPQRTWVGLTVGEIAEIVKTLERGNIFLAIQSLEAKLKEKNTC